MLAHEHEIWRQRARQRGRGMVWQLRGKRHERIKACDRSPTRRARQPFLPHACMHFSPQSTAQLDGAMDYLKKVGTVAIEKAALEEAGGVGVVVRAAEQPNMCTCQAASHGTPACMRSSIPTAAAHQPLPPMPSPHPFSKRRSPPPRSRPPWLTSSRPTRRGSRRRGAQWPAQLLGASPHEGRTDTSAPHPYSRPTNSAGPSRPLPFPPPPPLIAAPPLSRAASHTAGTA